MKLIAISVINKKICQFIENWTKKIQFFRQNDEIFEVRGSVNFAEGSAEPARPELTKDSAEPARFGRSL